MGNALRDTILASYMLKKKIDSFLFFF